VLVVGLFYSHTFFGPPSVVGGTSIISLIIDIVVNGDFDMVGKPVNDSPAQPAGSVHSVHSAVPSLCDSSPHDGSSHSNADSATSTSNHGALARSGAGQSIVSFRDVQSGSDEDRYSSPTAEPAFAAAGGGAVADASRDVGFVGSIAPRGVSPPPPSTAAEPVQLKRRRSSLLEYLGVTKDDKWVPMRGFASKAKVLITAYQVSQ
jgi:hypothetical protein